MTNSRPSPAAPRPDPRTVLLEAIEQRDALLSRKLVLQWVHRRGLASLQEFQSATLAPMAGSEACRWLEAILDGPPAAALPLPLKVPPTPAEEVAPPIRVHDLIDADAVRDSRFEELDRQSLAEVEAAFAALAAEFASAVPVPADPMPAAALPSPVAAASGARAGMDGAPPSQLAVGPEPESGGMLAPEPEGMLLAPEPEEMRAPRFPMPRLGRLTSLVRGCYAGALSTLQAARAGAAEPHQPLDEGDAVDESDADADGFVKPAELTAAPEPLGRALNLDLIGSPSAPDLAPPFQPADLLQEPADSRADVHVQTAVPVVVQHQPGAPAAPADPVAPLPAFHAPLIAGFKDLPAPRSSVEGVAAPDRGAHSNGSGVRQAMGALPFRLPSLRAVGASHRPAPAPDALADLRAWLPDDDLPRAC